MPTINSASVPTITSGNLFKNLTEDNTLNVRWLVATDPCFYATLNRPLADITLRQLIIAKSLDRMSIGLGSHNNFPFLVQAKLNGGTYEVDIPTGWIWDLQISTPSKWENFRLAKIQRISGYNSTDDEFVGKLRFIISANIKNSSIEVGCFYADYQIDSSLTYQRSRLSIATTDEFDVAVDGADSQSMEGFITFRTLDTTATETIAALEILAPIDYTDSNSDGYYDNPLEVEVVNAVYGGTGIEDYSTTNVNHGSGMFIDSVYNAIPPVNSSIESWVTAFNYPFDVDANMVSSESDGIVIPAGMFSEFSMLVPAGDLPSGSSNGDYYPIILSKIQQVDNSGSELEFIFTTYTTKIGSSSVTEIEFASLVLERDAAAGSIIAITSLDNLQLQSGTDQDLYNQHFGRGHVILSSLWANSSTEIDDFFDSFNDLGLTEATFNIRLSSFALDRSSKFSPTVGQGEALLGTTSNRSTPISPSSTNKFVTELDEGQGDEIDLESISGISHHEGIDRYGYTGGRTQKTIMLCIDNNKIDSEDTDFYDNEIYPRLAQLLGRAPVMFDKWFTGTHLLFYNGSTWQSH